MKKFVAPAPAPFAIQPWEHRGARFDSAPGATARVEIGGKRRSFLLKMRNGRIFFKEPARGQIYATLQRFDGDWSGEALLEQWEAAVEADDYGALVTKRDYFVRLSVRAQLIFLMRADGSARVQEHFDGETWFELPRAPVAVSLWHAGSVDDAAALLVGSAQNSLLNRAIAPAARAREAAQFVGCTRATFALLMRGALQAFVPERQRERLSFEVELKSHSAFQSGADNAPFGSIPESSPDFGRAWALLQTRHPFVGLDWHEGAEHSDYGRDQSARLSRAGFDKWGDNWRGNWAPQRARFAWKSDAIVSAHDQLESRLALRDFLAAIEAAELLGKL